MHPLVTQRPHIAFAEQVLGPFFALLLFAHWMLLALDGALEGTVFGGLSQHVLELFILHHLFTLIGIGLLKLHRLLAWPLCRTAQWLRSAAPATAGRRLRETVHTRARHLRY